LFANICKFSEWPGESLSPKIFGMWPAIRRVLGLDRRRAFDAAGGGQRWEGAKSVESLNAAILAGATFAARRSGPW
jgi:hypothetical protein